MYQAGELALTQLTIPSVTDSSGHESLRVFINPSLICKLSLFTGH